MLCAARCVFTPSFACQMDNTRHVVDLMMRARSKLVAGSPCWEIMNLLMAIKTPILKLGTRRMDCMTTVANMCKYEFAHLTTDSLCRNFFDKGQRTQNAVGDMIVYGFCPGTRTVVFLLGLSNGNRHW